MWDQSTSDLFRNVERPWWMGGSTQNPPPFRIRWRSCNVHEQTPSMANSQIFWYNKFFHKAMMSNYLRKIYWTRWSKSWLTSAWGTYVSGAFNPQFKQDFNLKLFSNFTSHYFLNDPSIKIIFFRCFQLSLFRQTYNFHCRIQNIQQLKVFSNFISHYFQNDPSIKIMQFSLLYSKYPVMKSFL